MGGTVRRIRRKAGADRSWRQAARPLPARVTGALLTERRHPKLKTNYGWLIVTNEWEIARGSGKCTNTGREFSEGESYYTVLFETPVGFERRDYSLEGWTGPPEGTFCYWRTRVPVRDRKTGALSIDTELLTQIFLRLEDELSEQSQQFRFVLALLLMRKRLLRFEQTLREDEREYWQMRLLADQSTHRVANPQLTSERVDQLGEQLLAILSGQVDAIESVTRPPAPGVTPESEPSPPATPAGESEDQVANS